VASFEGMTESSPPPFSLILLLPSSAVKFGSSPASSSFSILFTDPAVIWSSSLRWLVCNNEPKRPDEKIIKTSNPLIRLLKDLSHSLPLKIRREKILTIRFCEKWKCGKNSAFYGTPPHTHSQQWIWHEATPLICLNNYYQRYLYISIIYTHTYTHTPLC